jgi:hypothetical protein
MARKSKNTVASVLASIDPNMETAVTAGIVDHESQIASWVSEETANETLLEAALSELDCGDVERPSNDFADDELTELAELTALDEFAAFEDTQASPTTEIVERPLTLAEQMLLVPEEIVNATVVAIADEVDQRSRDETVRAISEGKDDKNIQGTIKKIRAQLVTKRAAKLMCAIRVEPNFINRVVHTGSAYNVYALGKLSDVVFGVTDGQVANAINIACMKSLFAFSKLGIAFTMECAKGAASKQYAWKIDAAVRKHLISHTVSTSTAPTQASSTMQALVTLGVVSTNGAGKNPTYTLLDTPIAHKLEAMLAAA